MGPIEKFRNVL